MTDSRELLVLALDAMGVLYEAADDVAELLVPFAHAHGSQLSAEQIEREYVRASLGQIDAAHFWQRIGVDAALEDQYLALHRLNAGVVELLAAAATSFSGVCCISNDVSSWSVKLRRQFGLHTQIAPFIISADVGIRKPDRGIYERLLAELRVQPERVLFVDDRVRNLDAARALGLRTLLCDIRNVAPASDHPRIASLAEVYSTRARS